MCAVLLQVDTVDTPAASTMMKRANPPRSIRIRICLELGNLADEQPLQCPVPPSSSSVLWCRPSHTARRVALTRSDDCREAPPLPFITLPYTDGMTTPHWRTHPGGPFKQFKTTPCWRRSTAIPISSRPSRR